MNNKKGQLRGFEDYFKSFITLIFGIIFVFAIVNIAPANIKNTLSSIGYTLIGLGIIILIISLIPKRYIRRLNR